MARDLNHGMQFTAIDCRSDAEVGATTKPSTSGKQSLSTTMPLITFSTLFSFKNRYMFVSEVYQHTVAETAVRCPFV